MTKEEKIAEAYQEYWIGLHPAAKKYALENNGWIGSLLDHAPKSLDLEYHKLSYRPRSLKGIETNNGYSNINSDSDLPKEEGVYWVLRRGFNKPMYKVVEYFDEEENKYWLENYTHFIKVVRPENLPIY